MASLAQNFDHVNCIYTVHGSLSVQVHSLYPSDKQSIQILPPSQAAQTAQTQIVENLQTQNPTAASPPPTQLVSTQPEPNQPEGQDSTTAT